MEDELQKRNTDCVYFLASPLTCKKGSECEYRHSETARLNPRDCWYWLNSNCLNPSCAFRHPPLEGLPETKPETAANLPTYASAAASKSSVPCYFYFNAYCIKGDQCPFMHDTFPSQKSSKVAPETTATHPPENKGPSGSDTGPATVEVPLNLSGDNFELTKQEPLFKEPTRQPAADAALEEASPSAESSEPFIKLPEENLASPREYMNGSSQVSPDHQGSEEILKECDDPDEWWESSPGFDVLVDDGSEQLPYEEDGDYQLPQEREPDMLHRRLLQFDYEVPPGYDPLGFPDASYLYEHGIYDGYDCVDNRHAPDGHFHRASENSTERRRRESDPPSHRKRKPSRRRHEAVDCGGGGSGEGRRDLRDHLRKQRRVEGGGSSGGGSKRYRSRSRGGSRERSRSTRGRGPSIHSRLVSEMVDSHVLLPMRSEGDRPADHFLGRGWSGYPESIRHARSRLRERDSRRRNRKLPPRALSSEISDGTDHTARAESLQTTKFAAAFSGPKTLAQIKEEKRRAMSADGSKCSESRALQNPRRRQQHGGGDFEGPKPLSELLKDKGRSVEGNGHANVSASMASEEDHQTGSYPGNRLSTFRSGGDDNGMDRCGTVGKKNSGYESDLVDDDDDDDDYDEDALREKLVKILSS